MKRIYFAAGVLLFLSCLLLFGQGQVFPPASSGSGSGTVSTGIANCVAYYVAANTTVGAAKDSGDQCRIQFDATAQTVDFLDSMGDPMVRINLTNGTISNLSGDETLDTLLCHAMADIAAPSNAGELNFGCRNGLLMFRAFGGAATYVPNGNSSGEATKGVAGAYDATAWNASVETPTKDAVRDKIEAGVPLADAFTNNPTDCSVTNTFATTIAANGNLTCDRPIGMFFFGHGNNAGAAASTTTYGNFGAQEGFNTTEGLRTSVLPSSCTARNLRFVTTTSQPGGGSLVVTLREGPNGTLADTALTITLAAGTAAGVHSDTTNTASLTGGEVISLEVVNNDAGASSANITSFSFQCN